MMLLERRTYPLLAVVLTATFVCVSVWRMSGGCPGPPYCVLESPVSANYLLLDPSNVSRVTEPYDLSLLGSHDRHFLIDLHNFTFHMNDPVCNSSSPPLFVVIIHSAPSNWENRRSIRSTWGQSAHLVFLVGETDSVDTQTALERENDEHHDLVQGSFKDSYRNLTYKHVLGLKWATYHCPDAKYVLKTDDDVFVNTPFLEEFLTRELSALGARRLVLCEVLSGSIVKRSYRSKWRVSHREYKNRWYPDYCTGWAILYSPDAVFRLYREAQRSEYFWIDDVHVTGTLMSRANLTHTDVGSLGASEPRVLSMMRKNQLDDFLFSLLSPIYYPGLWEMVNTLPRTSHPHQTDSSPQTWTGYGVNR
ncbi:beta-1,3-galactosyltransferase 5-like [Macrosteles quadrilineatus]|uniref:beta-1,3-galactosyltransferase 5-like n=1 Tax=Macrosteles quadrilineatus TaxID=74068 RepID=UPI0023E1720C|nr:beta-1,3-galactosyltransferase 5-like [Macrosteles quadrilineatus]XP_054289414.1 beta-1,3-galactosyltransferase 5-like [Macrosteles quadrilineatus]